LRFQLELFVGFKLCDHKKFGEFENVDSAYRDAKLITEDKRAFHTASIDNQMDIRLRSSLENTAKLRIELWSNPASNLKKSMELILLSNPLF
jgi:hypothetical protein